MAILKKQHSNKIFCIGLNKTGTTSLGTFLENVGYNVAKQFQGEALLPEYLRRDFTSIIKFCKKSKAQVFQDVPFSLPKTFTHLDNAFSDSKFILTIRDSDEKWYESILKFHSETFNNGNVPTYESLKESKYIYEGWAWDLMHDDYISNKDIMYDKEELTNAYNHHHEHVLNYFRHKPNQLIVINLSLKDDFKRLCTFLDIETTIDSFPRITSKDIVNRNYSSKFLR